MQGKDKDEVLQQKYAGKEWFEGPMTEAEINGIIKDINIDTNGLATRGNVAIMLERTLSANAMVYLEVR